MLKLHGLYPPLDRCAACGGPLPASGALSYHRGAHGFVCGDCGPASGPDLPVAARRMLADFFRRPPDALGAEAGAAAQALESFHGGLIAAHLERDLRSPRVIREIAREIAR